MSFYHTFAHVVSKLGIGKQRNVSLFYATPKQLKINNRSTFELLNHIYDKNVSGANMAKPYT